MKVSGIDKLTNEDLMHIAKVLIPLPFKGREKNYWKVVNFSILGIEYPGKAVISSKNHYRVEFSFDIGCIEVINETLGDHNSRVCPELSQWWQVVNFLIKKGCVLS